MSPHADERAPGDSRRHQLAALGVPENLLDSLAAATASPYRDLDPRGTGMPLADEPHLEAWREYCEEAASIGAAATLRRRLIQLAFPIREGIGGERAYRSSVLAGAAPPLGSGVRFAAPEGIRIGLHPTLGGTIPVVIAADRRDFDTLVRALTGRNEPIEVPATMGACLVQGLVNQDRVRRYRRDWAAERGGDDPAAWKEAFRQLATEKAAYQDRLLLLSTGPYSAVDASEAGRTEDEWREESLQIRCEHEGFHYLTLRLANLIRSDLLDEVAADLAGLLAVRAGYDAGLALRFLGLDRLPELRLGARAGIYRGGLDDASFGELQRITALAARGLADALEERPGLLTGDHRIRLPLVVAALGLPALASPGLGERLAELFGD